VPTYKPTRAGDGQREAFRRAGKPMLDLHARLYSEIRLFTGLPGDYFTRFSDETLTSQVQKSDPPA
jgi:hypothetical protein